MSDALFAGTRQTSRLVLRFIEDSQNSVCSLCRQTRDLKPGCHVSLGDSQDETICPRCIVQIPSPLVALWKLAEIAQRAGRIQKHSNIGVPMELLLQLAKASETFARQLEGRGSKG